MTRRMSGRVEALAIDPQRDALYASDRKQLGAFVLATGRLRWKTRWQAPYGLALAPNGRYLQAGGQRIDCARGGGGRPGEYGAPVTAVWCNDGRLVSVSYEDLDEGRKPFELRVADGPKARVRRRIRFASLRCIPRVSADGRRALVQD